MMIRSTVNKIWALLDPRERRTALKVLALMVVGAFASAVMVGSIFPFLSVLSDPTMIKTVPALAWVYRAGGFTSDYNFLVALGFAAIAVIFIANLSLIVVTWATARFSHMRTHTLSRRLLSHYLAQPYEYFLGRHSGDMSTNILSEAQEIVREVLVPLANLISGLLTVAAVVLTLLLIDPVVATATLLAFAGIYGMIAAFTQGRVRALGKRRANANEGRYRIAAEALGGIKDVKLLGREASYIDRYTGPSVERAFTIVHVAVLSQIPRYGIQVVTFGGLILLCLALLDPEGLHDRAALGGLFPLVGVLAFAGQRLTPEFQKIYQALTQITAGTAALERVHGDLAGGTKVQLPRTCPTPLGLRDRLTLGGITYTYPNAERPGLNGVDLEVRVGERIGIVGASGAGKTTFADIVLGLLAPSGGTLAVDGKVVNRDTMRAWQQSVGYVPQDIFLIDASLSENIAFGLSATEIDYAKVERVGRTAQLHDFVVAELVDGYATRIGERGVRLSGGQRQRIGIARALYHDADLIVFDEATSALDNLTERDVMSAIDALPGDTTVLMIAHRLSTVQRCDRIVVMEQGRVADVGPWDDLISRNAAFRAMAQAA